MTKQDNQPAGLFGAVQKLPRAGNHQPSGAELSELENLPDSELGVLNVYCRGCGTILHPHAEGGKELADEASISVPDDWKGKYFQVDQCVCCGDEFQNPQLIELE